MRRAGVAAYVDRSKIGDRVVTPRCGKPVEIQALWYNALRVQEQLASLADDPDRELFFREDGRSFRASFNRLFWNPGQRVSL